MRTKRKRPKVQWSTTRRPINELVQFFTYLNHFVPKQNLEERLARRKYLAGMHENEKKVAQGAVEHRKETNEQMLGSLVSDGKLNEKQRDELLKQYDADVNRLSNQHQLGECRICAMLITK